MSSSEEDIWRKLLSEVNMNPPEFSDLGSEALGDMSTKLVATLMANIIANGSPLDILRIVGQRETIESCLVELMTNFKEYQQLHEDKLIQRDVPEEALTIASMVFIQGVVLPMITLMNGGVPPDPIVMMNYAFVLGIDLGQLIGGNI